MSLMSLMSLTCDRPEVQNSQGPAVSLTRFENVSHLCLSCLSAERQNNTVFSSFAPIDIRTTCSPCPEPVDILVVLASPGRFPRQMAEIVLVHSRT